MSGFRKLAPVFSTCLLLFCNGKVNAYEKGPEFSRVDAIEGSDAILPCSLSSKENIEFKLFDWRKDGQKEVFMYDAGIHYNNGRLGQDEQFKGRVSHFSDQLKNGNASIKIQNTKVTDSGNYTCDFPRLQPSQTFLIKLVVELTIKDRSAEIDDAAPKPNIQTLNATDDRVRLQCDVQGASPKPEVEWQDGAGNILPAEEPQVSYRGERYYITLLTSVAKSDHYHCVVKQEEIGHLTEAEIFVFIHEFKDRSAEIDGASAGLIVAAVFATLLLVSVVEGVLFSKGIIKVSPIKRCWRHGNGSEIPPMSDHQRGTGLRTEPLLPGSDIPAQTSPV